MMRTVDLFAGAGGFSTGARAAGANVLACGNHWADAIAVHRANHPEAQHIEANLLELDPQALPEHDLLLASPACQGHSTASQPTRRVKHQADRNTAWAVVAMAEAHRPATVIVENVPAMQDWALFPVWRLALQALGYVVREHVFDTADFGVPQNRNRLIVTARQGEALELTNPKLPWQAFGPLVDWDYVATGRACRWAPIASKPEGVQKRVARARARGLGEQYLVHYSTDNSGRELDRPIGTLTTKLHWAVVRGDSIRMLTVDELRRGMGFADDYILSGHRKTDAKLLGNAIPPGFAEQIIRQTIAA